MCGKCDVCVCVKNFSKFDELRSWPSVSISLTKSKIKGGVQKKEQFCCEKREEQKFSFCRERNFLSVDSYLTQNSGNLAPHTKVVPL